MKNNRKPHATIGVMLLILLIAIMFLHTAVQAAILRETDAAPSLATTQSPIPSETTDPITDTVDTVSNLTDPVEPVNTPMSDTAVPLFVYPEAILWDNGPQVTHPGGGFGGADASALQTTDGMNTLGFGNQFDLHYRMTDDFEIANLGGWQIENITFFAYQTNASTSPSTITGVYYQVWDGPPNSPSSIVWGDLTTNRLISSVWSNIYRVPDDEMLLTTRPIMANRVSAGFTLPPGVYWLEWTTDGSLSSGPWVPPIAILGQTTTGNAMQFTTSWAPALDSGTNTPQGMPFIIEGTVLEDPVVPDFVVNLPVITNNFPFTPAAPVLYTIDNGDGDGNYSISWSSSEGADTYTAEEDDNAAFSSPTIVYTGANTSSALSGRDIGTYYYRVRAANAYASSVWSNIESVVVTVALPDCPQIGAWSGATSQSRNISFVVENSPRCQIAANSLRITIRNSCYFETTTTFARSFTITNNHFDTGSGGNTRVIGDFTSFNTASGTFTQSLANPWPPPYNCTASGSWSAHP